jgi:STIP1 homology and U-box containing protein 1
VQAARRTSHYHSAAHGHPTRTRLTIGRDLSIIADPRNPALYTNRAMARLKLELWDAVIMDCQSCLALAPENMKAFYYLAQAQLALHIYDDALENALAAHVLCAKTNDKSLTAITGQVLKCKKERWDAMENRRMREGQQLEQEVLNLMAKERDEDLKGEKDDTTREEVRQEWEAKIKMIQTVFEKARQSQERKRPSPPDWAIDDISFGVMIDPVMVS